MSNKKYLPYWKQLEMEDRYSEDLNDQLNKAMGLSKPLTELPKTIKRKPKWTMPREFEINQK